MPLKPLVFMHDAQPELEGFRIKEYEGEMPAYVVSVSTYAGKECLLTLEELKKLAEWATHAVGTLEGTINW